MEDGDGKAFANMLLRALERLDVWLCDVVFKEPSDVEGLARFWSSGGDKAVIVVGKKESWEVTVEYVVVLRGNIDVVVIEAVLDKATGVYLIDLDVIVASVVSVMVGS